MRRTARPRKGGKATAHKHDKIDTLVKTAFDAQANHWFKIDPVARQIREQLGPPPPWKGLNLSEIILGVIKGRLSDALKATDPQTGLRIYENYADGNAGGRRWQKFTGMTAPELRVCIAAREAQIAGHERIVTVYRALLADLDRAAPGTLVGSVVDPNRDYLADAQ